MHILHFKSCSQDLCLCCCFGRRNMRCLYMHTTLPWSCIAETILFVQSVTNVFWPRIQLPGSYCYCIHVCHRTLSKNQGCPVFNCSIRVLSTLFAPYFWFLLRSVPSEVSTVLFFHGTAPPSKFYFHRKPRYKTKTRKPKTDSGKYGYSVLDNGGHLVREKRKFYRTCQISVGFDRRTDILRKVCFLRITYFS